MRRIVEGAATRTKFSARHPGESREPVSERPRLLHRRPHPSPSSHTGPGFRRGHGWSLRTIPATRSWLSVRSRLAGLPRYAGEDAPTAKQKISPVPRPGLIFPHPRAERAIMTSGWRGGLGAGGVVHRPVGLRATGGTRRADQPGDRRRLRGRSAPSELRGRPHRYRRGQASPKHTGTTPIEAASGWTRRARANLGQSRKRKPRRNRMVPKPEASRPAGVLVRLRQIRRRR
jgi:hypothetical protein